MAKDLSIVQRTAFICNGDSCLKKGAADTTTQLRAAIAAAGAKPHLHTVRTQCTDQCPHGPVIFIHPEGTWYQHLTADKAETLVASHLLAGELLAESILYQG
ncbi:MAG: (2Fe-2S) ferredoxin domain-containing protein [Hymenobacter sp.]|nr:MAG: (2Fe-2S) ferredoxin domain-containing protein [Hymenobacter sp.]